MTQSCFELWVLSHVKRNISTVADGCSSMRETCLGKINKAVSIVILLDISYLIL